MRIEIKNKNNQLVYSAVAMTRFGFTSNQKKDTERVKTVLNIKPFIEKKRIDYLLNYLNGN